MSDLDKAYWVMHGSEVTPVTRAIYLILEHLSQKPDVAHEKVVAAVAASQPELCDTCGGLPAVVHQSKCPHNPGVRAIAGYGTPLERVYTSDASGYGKAATPMTDTTDDKAANAKRELWADDIMIHVTSRGLRFFRNGKDVTCELLSFELSWNDVAGSTLKLEPLAPDHRQCLWPTTSENADATESEADR